MAQFPSRWFWFACCFPKDALTLNSYIGLKSDWLLYFSMISDIEFMHEFMGYFNWMMCSDHCFQLYIYMLDYLKIVARRWLQDLNLNYTSCTPLCRGLVQGASVWISGELHINILNYTQAFPKFQSWLYHPFGIVYCIATWHFYTTPVNLIMKTSRKHR